LKLLHVYFLLFNACATLVFRLELARRTSPQFCLDRPLATPCRTFFPSPTKESGAVDVLVPAALINKAQVRGLFSLWNSSLATKDARIVAKRYSKDPIVFTIESDIPCTDYASIKNNYELFLQRKPQGEILDGKILIGHNWANDAGICEFTLGTTGEKIKARYSFFYEYEDGQWKIAQHHLSEMPEQKGRSITPEHAENLFHLWNDALDTLDSTAIAKRYSKDATLLPAVSDTPLTGFANIKEYFDNFLQLQPHAVILESHVAAGDNFCNHVGVYELTMRATGGKVKANFSFVYVYEDMQWKILHHHSAGASQA
jgi:hypothetical protein